MAIAIAIFGVIVLLRVFHSLLTGFVPRVLSRPTSEEKELAKEVKKQRNQLHLIDAQNEFAKFAKLQRKIKKGETILSTKAHERQKQGLKVKGILWILSILISISCHLWIVWTYRHSPVAKLPTQWLHPLNSILKFPTNIDGAIGLPSWLFISNSVILLVQSL